MDIKKISLKVAAKFAADLPEELKKHQFTKNDPDNPNPKGNDRDGDGKTNEPKPDWADKKSSIIPKGVVAALTNYGDIRIFEANNPKAADGIKRELMAQNGEYVNIVHGPNLAGRTADELYDHFEERWAGEVPEAFKKNWKNKKDDKGGKKDDKKDDKSDDKKDDKGGLPPWLNKKKKSHDMTATEGPYGTVTFKRSHVKFTMVSPDGKTGTGSEPYGSDPLKALERVIAVIRSNGISGRDVEVI